MNECMHDALHYLLMHIITMKLTSISCSKLGPFSKQKHYLKKMAILLLFGIWKRVLIMCTHHIAVNLMILSSLQVGLNLVISLHS